MCPSTLVMDLITASPTSPLKSERHETSSASPGEEAAQETEPKQGCTSILCQPQVPGDLVEQLCGILQHLFCSPESKYISSDVKDILPRSNT